MAAGFPFWARINETQNATTDELITDLQVYVDFNRLLAANLKIGLFFHARESTGTVSLRIGGTYGNTDGTVIAQIAGAVGSIGFGVQYKLEVTIANTYSDFQLVKLTTQGITPSATWETLQPGFTLEGAP